MNRAIQQNQTAQDAHARLTLSRVGSLADRPSEEYLSALRTGLYEWIEQIDQRRSEIANKTSMAEQLCVEDFEAKPTCYGIRTGDEGEWVAWALFNIADVKATGVLDEDSLDGYDVAHWLTDWVGKHGGAGRSFALEPWARLSRNRVLVTQSGGLDI